MGRKLIICIILFVYFSCKNKKVYQSGNYIFIPQGIYTLGADSNYLNNMHTFKSDGFWISKFETTNAQFDSFVSATKYITIAEKYKNAQVYKEDLEEFEWFTDSTANWKFPNGKKYGGIENKMNYPVTCICKYDMIQYCKWKNMRLPLLDEWEIAARAGSSGMYFFGNEYDSIKKFANIWHAKTHRIKDSSDGYCFASPVGKFNPNKFGLYDIYGNVFEMCADVPAAFKDIENVCSARGGSWWCSKFSCNFVNNISIGKLNIYASFSNMGFREVRDKK